MIVIDTHFCVWLVDRPDLLRAPERQFLDENASNLLASVVSLWELRVKWEARYASGNRKGPLDPRDVAEGLLTLGIPVIELTPDQAIAPLAVPLGHKDPFDTLLVAQTQELGARLFTRDGLLTGHPLALATPSHRS